MSEMTQAQIVIKASPADVLSVVSDLESYPQWANGVRAMEILEKDDQGRALQARVSIDGGPLKDTYVLGYTWPQEPTEPVGWHLVQGGTVTALDGSYTVEPHPEGSLVTYRLQVQLRIPMLAMMRRRAERAVVDGALEALKNRCESKVGNNPGAVQ